MTQEEALDILKLGHNVFLTGPAGSGKTFLLNEYIKYLKANKVAVGVTASTGIASTHINGRTIHSWTGLKVIDRLLDRPAIRSKIRRLQHIEDLVKQYRTASVLVIDEISMLDSQYLDIIDETCRAMRQSIAPFGGLQIVLCGDFFQLPPVSTPQHEKIYAFKSRAWKETNFKICYLEGQQRFIDNKFVTVLNNIRHNSVNKDTLEVLKLRLGKPVCGSVRPTRLYTNNYNVDAMNDIEIGNIKAPACAYQMKTFYKEKEHRYLRDQLVKHCMAPYRLILKVGAVVMFVKNNFDQTGINLYVNGTLGKIVDFQAENKIKFPVVLTNDGRRIVAYPQSWRVEEANENGDDEIVASITQIPLRLAWAITVHKSQGLSLDEAVIDLSRAFEYGMGYVALSRVRSLGGMVLLGLNRKALEVNPEISKLDEKLLEKSRRGLGEFKKIKRREMINHQKEFIEHAQQGVDQDLFGEVFKS